MKGKVIILLYSGSIFSMQKLDTTKKVFFQKHSLKTLAAEAVIKYVEPDPYGLLHLNIPKDLLDKLGRRWCSCYPEKVPFFVEKITFDDQLISPATTLNSNHHHRMMSWNKDLQQIFVFDVRSGNVVKKISTSDARRRTALLSRDESAVVMKLGNHNLMFYDLETDESYQSGYDGNISLFPVHFDKSDNDFLMVSKDHITNKYVMYQINPWQKKYEFFLLNNQMPMQALLGATKNHIVVNNGSSKKIQFFDRATGSINHSINLGEQEVKNLLVSYDGGYVAGNLKDQYTGEKKTVLYYPQHANTSVSANFLHPTSYATPENLYSAKNNCILSLRKPFPQHERLYIPACNITGKSFAVHKECMEHNFLLLLSDANEWAMSTAKKPQSLDELLSRMSAAELVVKKSQPVQDKDIEHLKKYMSGQIDPIAHQAILGVLRSYDYRI